MSEISGGCILKLVKIGGVKVDKDYMGGLILTRSKHFPMERNLQHIKLVSPGHGANEVHAIHGGSCAGVVENIAVTHQLTVALSHCDGLDRYTKTHVFYKNLPWFLQNHQCFIAVSFLEKFIKMSETRR